VVGPADRLEYTAIGTPISTAAVLAQSTKGTSVVFTEDTWAELPKKRYNVESLVAGERRIYRLTL